jgi:hypothetical protein
MLDATLVKRFEDHFVGPVAQEIDHLDQDLRRDCLSGFNNRMSLAIYDNCRVKFVLLSDFAETVCRECFVGVESIDQVGLVEQASCQQIVDLSRRLRCRR